MSNYKLNRRQFITSSGVIFTLPLLESLFPWNHALAQVANDPRRYVAVYFPNGSVNRKDVSLWYTDTGVLGSVKAPPVLDVFPSHLSNISVLKSVNLKNRGASFSDDHEAGATYFFTAEGSLTSTTNSFEYIVGDAVKKNPLIIHSGSTKADLPNDRYSSYRNGKGQVGYSNPGDLYRELLAVVVPSTSGGGTTPPAPVVATVNGRSVIDSALADFSQLNSKLGKADKEKLDEYLTSLRALEAKVVTSSNTSTNSSAGQVTASAACVKPTLNSQLDNTTQSPSLYLQKFYAFNDMIKIAFACDITRSVNIMIDTETSERSFENAPASLVYNGVNIGGVGSHSGISHASDFTRRTNLCCTRDRYLMQVVTDLMTKLGSVKDPSGSSILDNTIIHAGFGVMDGNHLGDTGSHPALTYNQGHPMIVAGAKNFLKQGQSHDLTGSSMADLFMTFSKHLNLGLTAFKGSSTIITKI